MATVRRCLVCAGEAHVDSIREELLRREKRGELEGPLDIEVIDNPQRARVYAKSIVDGVVVAGPGLERMGALNMAAALVKDSASFAYSRMQVMVAVMEDAAEAERKAHLAGIDEVIVLTRKKGAETRVNASAENEFAVAKAPDVAPVPTVAKLPVRQRSLALVNLERCAKTVVVCSAQGATGKSTLALLLAVLAARSGKRTALVELDAQFGALRVYAGFDPEKGLVDTCNLDRSGSLARELARVGHELEKGCHVFIGSKSPEKAERLWSVMPELLATMQESHEVVVVDTPSTWNDAVAHCMERSHKILLVGQERAGCARALKEALDLIGRMGVERTKVSVVVNRSVRKRRDQTFLTKLGMVLGIASIVSLVDGGDEVDMLAQQGGLKNVLDVENRFGKSVRTYASGLFKELGLGESREKRGGWFGARRA